MADRRRVPEVLWKLFQNRARTLAQTLLSFIPPDTLQCRCNGTRRCLRCRSDGDPMSFLLTEDDPLDYRKLLNHCFVVVSDNAPLPLLYDHPSLESQIEVVRRTIEMILLENESTNNVICMGYDKRKRSSIIVEDLSSSLWCLLLKRIGDGLMVHLLKYCSIFMPLNRKKHRQVAGTAINGLCWEYLKQISKSKKQQQLSPGVPERRFEADNVSTNTGIPESCVTCNGNSTTDAYINHQCTHENGVPSVVAETRKRVRSHACRRQRKRRKLPSSQDMCDTISSLSEEKMKSLCCCCSVWQTLQKVPTRNQINKRPMLYKLERTSSIFPEKHILNSLRPNVSGANTLFKDIFGLSDSCFGVEPNQCSHNNDTCVIKTTCLYHSLHKLLRKAIRKANHCPRVKLLNKYILIQNPIEGNSPTSEQHSNYSCSKRQVASFIWGVCTNILPQELLGNWRILRKNIFKFIRLRIYEKFSLHQCMYKLKILDFQFLSGFQLLPSTKRNLVERWIYWLFACFIVPLLQVNFFVTESELGKREVFFYEKSAWEKLMKTSITRLNDECYRLVNVTSVKNMINSRTFGFSRVRFLPKANGIRPLANLKLPSRLQYPHAVKEFKAVNAVLQDLHAALKDVQNKVQKKLGSSVFSYNDVHRNLTNFLSRVKNGSSILPCVYMVVADVQKAYDSINQDKLLHVMKDVIVDDHLLHQTHQIIASNRHLQVCPYINLHRQFRSHVQNRSSHTILVGQGRTWTAKKDELHFNLRQHVKNNLVCIDKRFYHQNVGIPQGSILSSLLCSFYFGHMESTKLFPYLDKVASKLEFPESLLLRFIDDFLFISTSKELALGFLSRLQRGFCEYNCKMNTEKFGFSFDNENENENSRSYFDENGTKFLKWSGLLINCKTLEVQADYTRYLDAHLRSTLTVCWQGNPGEQFRKKIRDYLRPKCNAIFYDSNINSAAVVRLNIHQAFLLCAMKFHCYVCDLSHICSFLPHFYLDIIHDSLRYMYRLMKKRMYAGHGLGLNLKVKRREVECLGLTAYIEVLKRKQSRYKDEIYLLELELELKVKMWCWNPEFKFVVDKSNSSVLWKIKY